MSSGPVPAELLPGPPPDWRPAAGEPPGLLELAGVARGRGPGARGGAAADAAPLSA